MPLIQNIILKKDALSFFMTSFFCLLKKFILQLRGVIHIFLTIWICDEINAMNFRQKNVYYFSINYLLKTISLKS